MRGVTRVTAFVDWDTARRVVQHDYHKGRSNLDERALFALQDKLAQILVKFCPASDYRILMRLYHGWYSGKTKSVERRQIEELIAEQRLSRVINRCSFPSDFEFGDHLLCGGSRCVLYDTLRTRDGVVVQKMVDTALVSDLLTFVRCNRNDIALVVGDDDDLLPGVFTADAWGGKVLVARMGREGDNPHLETKGLVYHN